jgi:hypothetical protein
VLPLLGTPPAVPYQIDIRRVPSRQIGVEVLQRSLDFGIPSPGRTRSRRRTLGSDELVMLMARAPAGGRQRVTMSELASRTSSPWRGLAGPRVLRLFQRRHES